MAKLKTSKPAFLFYSREFYETTRMLTPEERACLIDLMIYQHLNGSIPLDLPIPKLKMYCSGISEDAINEVLNSHFEQKEHGYVNLSLDGRMKKESKFRNKQSINGIIGNFWLRCKKYLNDDLYGLLKSELQTVSALDLYEKIKDIDFSKIDAPATLIECLKGILGESKFFDSPFLFNNFFLKGYRKEDIDKSIYRVDEGKGEEGKKERKEKEENLQGNFLFVENLDSDDKKANSKKENPKIEPEIEPKIEKTWRNDFEFYRSEIWKEFDLIKKDKEWLAEQLRLNPGVDVLLSFEKSIKNFWETEEGWLRKCKSKSITLNWKMTLARTIGLNKVYLPRKGNNNNQQNGDLPFDSLPPSLTLLT